MAALCVAIFTGSNAMAQPGDGIRIAGSKLVPSVDVYSKYETNPGRLAESQGPKGDVSRSRESARFRKAGADLGLDASSSLVYDYFFGLSDQATKQYSAFSGDFTRQRECEQTERISNRRSDQSYGQPTLKSAHSTGSLSIRFSV